MPAQQNRRIDKSVAEPLLRIAISDLTNASNRISALAPTLFHADPRKASKLSTAQKRIAETQTMLRDFADANGVELRDTMKT